MSLPSNRSRAFAANERGASIVIALVFFLICGIIGSVVMTAASVQAKSVQTHKDLQQAEYTMQSAAELVAMQLGGDDATFQTKSVDIKVAYADGKAAADVSNVVSSLGLGFWTVDRAEEVLAAHANGAAYVVGASEANRLEFAFQGESQGLSPVFGMITVDANLNVTIDLSLDRSFSSDSPYNMTVFAQCTPTYNAVGQLTAFSYGDNTTIEKTAGGQL